MNHIKISYIFVYKYFVFVFCILQLIYHSIEIPTHKEYNLGLIPMLEKINIKKNMFYGMNSIYANPRKTKM